MPILAYRGLGLSASTMGAVMSIAAAGAVIGTFFAQRVSRRLGAARMMPVSIFLHSFVGLGILLAPMLPSAVVLAATLALYGTFMVWYNVSTAAVRQARVPAQDQAVSHAAFRTITWGVIPLSVFASGIIVQLLTGGFGILNAARIAMVFGTLIGAVFAWIPMLGLQGRIVREKAEAQTAAEPAAPDSPAELAPVGEGRRDPGTRTT
jgi:MFS family permease